MNVCVVDVSALGALVFGEPEADKTAAQLSDGLLAAPALLPFELAGQMAIETVEFKYLHEFAAEDRFQGRAMTFSLIVKC